MNKAKKGAMAMAKTFCGFLDFTGRELRMHDWVAVIKYNVTSAEFCKGEVIGFTSQYVRIAPLDGEYPFLATPRKIVKIPKQVSNHGVNVDGKTNS